MNSASYIHEINGFYIVASDQVPVQSHGFNHTSLDIFNKAIQLFGSFLDQDNDGIID